MKFFLENKCRLCKSSFCCVQCRLKHEEIAHGIQPECDICVYGRAILKDLPSSLENHVKKNHWPLHCVYCNIIFCGSFDEILEHDKCPVRKLQSKILPQVVLSESNKLEEQHYESPPVNSKSIISSSNKNLKLDINISCLTTSTPMQRNEERLKLENIFETVTPLGDSETKIPKEKLEEIKETIAVLSPPINDNISCQANVPTKRRVTFSETTPESNTNFDAGNNQQASILKIKYNQEDTKINEREIKTQEALLPNSTLWESALNTDDISSIVNENITDSNASNLNLNNELTENASFKCKENLKPPSIWTSVANMVNSIFSIHSNEWKEGKITSKRNQPDCDEMSEWVPQFKKIKFSDIRGRRPIRPSGAVFTRRPVKITCDKSTQTD